MSNLFTERVLNMAAVTPQPEDYTGEDGLLYCGKCHTPKEAYFPEKQAALFGRDRHPAECDCQKAQRLEREAAEQRRKHLDTVEDLKRRGFTNPTMQEWTFANDNGKCPQMEIAHFYVEHWEIMREENIGYLLWGKVGTGKSYFAGCIANALMEQEVAVRMTNFSAILNDLTASFEGRNEYIERLCRFPLLNRLQVFFDGKPDEAARDELKANGFRWAPSVGAWQRQLNKNAYYAAGYISCIQPISGEKPIDVQRSAQQQESATPDAHLTGERVSTPRGSFHVANMSREQMEAAGYGYHHSTDDGKYLIMGNGTQAFAIAAEQREQENYMRTAELSTEQNYNMIDGQINNTPSVDELEEKAKRGEVISLSALAAAVKTEDGRTPQRDPDGKKPSIRAQLKADRAQSCKPQQREKKQEAKRSIRQALEME